MSWSKNILYISFDLSNSTGSERLYGDFNAIIITWTAEIRCQLRFMHPKKWVIIRNFYFDTEGRRELDPEDAIKSAVKEFMKLDTPTGYDLLASQERVRLSRKKIHEIQVNCHDNKVKELFLQQFNLNKWAYYKKISKTKKTIAK